MNPTKDMGAPSVAPSSSLSEMEAYDLLPEAVRQATHTAPYGMPARTLYAFHLRGYSEARLLAIIERGLEGSRLEAIKRGMPRELVGWGPIKTRPGARRRRSPLRARWGEPSEAS